MTAQEQIDAIERERVRKERELLVFLSIIARQSQFWAIRAEKLETDIPGALRKVWLGAPHFKGAVKPLAQIMADSHITGYLRAARMVGTEAPAPSAVELTTYYTPRAQQQASQMLDTLSQRVSGDLAGIFGKDVILTIRKSFADGGYTVENPTALERGAEFAVVQAGNDGAADAMQQPDAKHYGYRHYSVLDHGTTQICRERNLITLPKDAPYWRTNWVRLHWGCRSIINPWMQEGPWSTVPNNLTPPAPGFGIMPSYLWAGLERAAA